ncbi:hypothetical protein OPT61_g3697 [Boeremia exigua]|uniref:Uncharacterized protein n=1 Tax=Boeremia exigua TaxID=749465 RepID=A0ACC2IGT3_9PLEO|nr:hypothetical protein OPT61_g3697 [Boeremia exigua]
MDGLTTPTPLRRSSRKRPRTTTSSDPDAVGHETPRSPSHPKRQAVESPDTRTPDNRHPYFRTTTPCQQVAVTDAADAEATKPMNATTAAEIVESNARCRQCKARGYAKCWYNGNDYCEPCIKEKRQCGAFKARRFIAKSFSLRRNATPGPEHHSADKKCNESVSRKASGVKPTSSARRNTRQSTASTPCARRNTRGSAAPTLSPKPNPGQASAATERSALVEVRELRHGRSARRKTTDAQSACTVVERNVRGEDSEVASAPLSDAPLYGSRRTARHDRSHISPHIVQEPTPEDSAVEETMSLSGGLDASDDEQLEVPLTPENRIDASPGLVPVTESDVLDDNLVQANGLDHDSSDEVSTSHQRPLSATDQRTSRSRRSHGRPSYVEHFLSDSSDQEDEHGDDDLWDPPAAEDESDVDEDEELSLALESSSDEAEDYEEPELVDIEPDVNPAPQRRTQLRAPKQGKGIDLSLPPLDNISDIVADMASRSLELGLRDALLHLKGQPINVATMCSGTESPLIFLQMLAEALESMGETSFNVNHRFSAEIDATKQAYIERNFQPPVLFRDVRQLGDDTATTATTAYGAEEPIPAGIDILIAGFVCKDLSSLNSSKKTVDDQGETGDTWRAIYYYAKRFRPRIVLLENVKSDKKVWDDVVSRWSRIGYEAAWVYCDTKKYYLPQTRERMYMIAIDRQSYGKGVSDAVAQWQSTMHELERPCSSPCEAFLVNLPVKLTDHSSLSTEPDWSLCKLSHAMEREWNITPAGLRQSSVVRLAVIEGYDAIDVAHLQAAKEGYDSMYKTIIWDVSQNVDRFKIGMGLVPCITPGGCHFASNRQAALSGSHMLVFQGMPLDKLQFFNETPRECQDLAGNAMSTPVIGASSISTLINAYKAITKKTSTDGMGPSLRTKLQTQSRLVRASNMVQRDCRTLDPGDIDVAQLLDEAKFSSRLCACEGDHEVGNRTIKVCSGCGHTACVVCASNPRHQYVDSIPQHLRKQVPDEFVRLWRARLPPRLELQNFPNPNSFLSRLRKKQDIDEAYARRIVEVNIGSQPFNLSEFVRCDNAWRIVYIGNEAKMVLSIGEKVQWLLYVDCLPGVPGNSELRKALETPVARAVVGNSILEVQWEMFALSPQDHVLHMHGSAEQSISWRNQLGLPDYQAEMVPARIRVGGNNESTSALAGDYTHLPHCGTAEASLYKRASEPVLYLFLDPNPIGEANRDSFVFSLDCSRKQWGESRMIVARLDPTWRPRQMSGLNEQHDVAVVRTGSWITIPAKMVTLSLASTANVLIPDAPLTGLGDECTSALCVLDVYIPEELQGKTLSDYSWALEQAKAAPSLEHWQSIDAGTPGDCTCAPAYPNLLWSVDKAGKATPHEDRKAAATFEKGIKARCSAFHVQPTVSKNQTRIAVGIIFGSLAHRARERLARFTHNPESISTGRRLLVNHANAGPVRFPKFHLSSNATDASFSGPLSLKKELRGAQPRALSWMRAQETGIPLTITEIEEAVHPDLGWRVEARAQTTMIVRGGVLADRPSFGKTVTTIALIQSEFERSSPEAIMERNQAAVEHPSPSIDTAATLIVCPPHIVMQWQTELQLFLDDEHCNPSDVCVIRDMAELKQLTVDDIQRCRVVIVSWTVLSDDEYISELAWMTAMPEPAISSCRAFDAWMDGMSKSLPAQISNFQNMSLADFKHATQDLLEQRLQQPEFQATLPLKLQHGSKYQSYEATRAVNSQKKSGSAKPGPKRKSSSPKTQIAPLLHLFRFNRVVVDEYHYLNDYKKIRNMLTVVSVKKIGAHKRWILSGTPALANFTDINNIASFLGVRLGRFAPGVGKRTALEKFLMDDQTSTEGFLSKIEVMSRQWHQARHERAQEFLNLFVRQNEASLEHIPCHDELRALELGNTHRVVTSRLNASLNHSKTAEDALLKVALIDDTSEGSLIEKRLRQRRDIEQEISRLMRAFEWHRATGFKNLKPADSKKVELEENTIPKLYASFRHDVKNNTWLGDTDVTTITRRLLHAAEKNHLAGGLEELGKVSRDKKIKEAKSIMARLRESCTELSAQTRSVRFAESLQQLSQALRDSVQDLITRDAEACQKTVTISEVYVASQCGHITCKPCVMARGDDENCVAPGCNCMVKAANLIKATDIGSTTKNVAEGAFGRKMHSIAKLIKTFPEDDQGLVFAPNDEVVAILREALDHYDISYSTPCGYNSRQATKTIEEFKSSAEDDPEVRPKVLLLNLGSETAAGINLTNANHIIFVAPLLVESQYKYDSAMTQAIARSRRYGQQKAVRVYHFAALRTIDVDILEHRHKSTYGITTAKSTIRMPAKALATREKTRMIKSQNGSMALVPLPWLADK